MSRLTSQALAVLDTGDRHVVAVANGVDGFAARAADGEWRRIGFPGFAGYETPVDLETAGDPEPVEQPNPQPLMMMVLLGTGIPVTAAGLLWLMHLGAGRNWWWLLTPLVLASVFLALTTLLASSNPSYFNQAAQLAVPIANLAAISCSLTALINATRMASSRRR